MNVLHRVWPVLALSLSVVVSLPSASDGGPTNPSVVTPIRFGLFALGPGQEAILSLTNTGPETLPVEIVVRDDAGAIISRQSGTLQPGTSSPRSGYVFSIRVGVALPDPMSQFTASFTASGKVMARRSLAVAVDATVVIIDQSTGKVISLARMRCR